MQFKKKIFWPTQCWTQIFSPPQSEWSGRQQYWVELMGHFIKLFNYLTIEPVQMAMAINLQPGQGRMSFRYFPCHAKGKPRRPHFNWVSPGQPNKEGVILGFLPPKPQKSRRRMTQGSPKVSPHSPTLGHKSWELFLTEPLPQNWWY